MYNQASPKLLNMHIKGCDDFAVSKQKFNYSFLQSLGFEDQFSATKDAVVHLDLLDLHSAPFFGGE